MELNNKFGIAGKVRLIHKDSNRNVKSDTGWLSNTITTAGLAAVSGLVGNTGSQTAFTYLAVGTDSTAENAAHTALQAEITDTGLERVSATVSRQTTTATNDTLQLYHVFTATGNVTVEEVGAFNAASAGVMLGRKLTSTKALANGETLTVTYKFIFS